MTLALPLAPLELSPHQVLLTPQEAATALRVSHSVLFALVRSQQLRSISIGHCRRIPVEALHDFVRTQLHMQNEGR
jgi:excisionase family DNA binding protein